MAVCPAVLLTMGVLLWFHWLPGVLSECSPDSGGQPQHPFKPRHAHYAPSSCHVWLALDCSGVLDVAWNVCTGRTKSYLSSDSVGSKGF